MGFNIPSFAEIQFLGTYYEWVIWVVALVIVAALLIVLLTSRRTQKSPLLGSLMAGGGLVLALPALFLAFAIGMFKANSQMDFGPFSNLLVQLAIQFQPLAYLSIFGGLLALAGLALYLAGVGSPRRPIVSDPIYSGQDVAGGVTITDAAITFSQSQMSATGMSTPQMPGDSVTQGFQNPGTENMNTGFFGGQGEAGPSAGKTVILRTPPPVVKAWLMAREGSFAGRKFDIATDNVRIGRNSTNDIVIGDESISGDHARIKQEDGAYFIYDLASTNGTFKKSPAGDWIKIYHEGIADGDQIKLGQTVFSFYEMPTLTE